MRLLDKLFCSGGFQFPVATTSCNKHCDLSVTNIRRVCTLIGVHLLSTWPVLRGSGKCLLHPPWMGGGSNSSGTNPIDHSDTVCRPR